MSSNRKCSLYEKAFPEHLESIYTHNYNGIVTLIKRVWPKQRPLKLLCFGYGNGLTEAVLFQAIKTCVEEGTGKKAEIHLIDTKSTKYLYGDWDKREGTKNSSGITISCHWLDEKDKAGAPGKFDIVTAYFCLHFISGWPDELRWLAQRVRPNGLISFAIERGYRAYIDGATRIDEPSLSSEAWREYHGIRLDAGDGWLPDICASDLGVISLITAGDFTPVIINKSECVTINYTANKLTEADIRKIIGLARSKSGRLFFPLLNSTPALWKNDPKLRAISFESATQEEKADIFFLKRISSGSLWKDDAGYINKVSLALLSHSLGAQNKIILPVLQAGESDEKYLQEMRKKLRNILHIIGMHYLRHCRRIACEPVFVQYKKMSELYTAMAGERGYLPSLPMLIFGPKTWRQKHKVAYGTWRKYLSNEKSGVAWIGQYVMELFPWVGAWIIEFNSNNETTAAIKKHRYAPHYLEGQDSVWGSHDQVDVLEIKISKCCKKSLKNYGYGVSDFEWIENTDNQEGTDLKGMHPEQSESISTVLKALFTSSEAPPSFLEALSDLLAKLAHVNCAHGLPWKKIVTDHRVATGNNNETARITVR